MNTFFYILLILASKTFCLDIEEKIYQMLWASFDIHQSTEIIEYTKKGIGGIHLIWGKYSLKDTRKLLKEIYKNHNPPPFIAIDYEGGSVYTHQTHGLLNLPSNMALGVAKDWENTTTMFYLLGLELKKAGINTVFAPTLDVNTEKNNPIINIRSFGNDREIVTKMANAVIDGFLSSKIINVVKHFPGHGMTDTDSHLTTPIVNIEPIELYKTHIYTFKEIIEKGKTDIVMLSHVIYKNIDPKNPASLSKNIISILREELKFNGIIMTDSMDMKAITSKYDIKDAAVISIKNGSDMVLIGRYDPEKVKKQIVKSLKSGEISTKKIEESYKRITDIKKKYNLSEFVIEDNEFDIAYKQIALEIANKSIKIVKGKIENLKQDKIKMIFFIPQRFSKEAIIVYEKLKKNNLDINMIMISSNKININKILTKDKYDTLIIANYSWPKISEKKLKIITQIAEKFHKKIFINLLNPIDSEKISTFFDCVIETYGINEYSASALADKLIENTP